MATQYLTKLYEGLNLSGAAADVIFLPILFPGTLNAMDVLTDENTAGNVVFALYKNGIEQTAAAVTVLSGAKIGTVSGLSIALVKGDEIVLRRTSGAISAPITLNLLVDDGVTILTTEDVQDIVAAMMQPGTNSSWIYNDAAGTLSVDSPQLTTEEVQDKIAELLSGGANTTVTYNDGANTLVIAETTAGKTQEEIEDIVANLLAEGSNVTLTYNDAGNVLTIAATGGSSSPTMQSVTYTTASLADGAEETGTVTIGKVFTLLKVTADKESRVRVYQSSAYRTADAGRIIGDAPEGEHGVILDAYILTSNLTLDLSPTPIGNSAESTRTSSVPVSIQNKSGATGTVAITFYYLVLEA